MDSWCRICSRSDDFRRFPLYAVAEVSQEVIANMITCCTDTQVSGDDGLPQQICPDCLITLSLAYSFRKLCRRSDAKYRECFRESAPSQSNENQQHQQHNLSQAQDESAYEHITAIKEEVEFYDYECEVLPQENQWVIQNPRTIREGAMTVVHNSGQYYEQTDELSCADMGASLPALGISQGHIQPELGEPSTSFQKSEKLKKKLPVEPERFSKRIRQEIPSHKDAACHQTSSSCVVNNTSRPVVSDPAQQRCEYCKKKMKKSYKHRNGKCLIMKSKSPSKSRCVYCNMTFVRSASLPGHLRNTCRVYREVCKMKGIDEPDPSMADQLALNASPAVETPTTSVISPVQDNSQNKTIDQKPLLTKARAVCEYCEHTFSHRSNLLKHQQNRCKVLREMKAQTRTKCVDIKELLKTEPKAPVQVPQQRTRSPSSIDNSAMDEDQSDKLETEEETQCVYCTQKVGKKTRYLHHNGRCVLGRAASEHPCPYCPNAFSSRSNLLRHQREHCTHYQNEQPIKPTRGVHPTAPVATRLLSPVPVLKQPPLSKPNIKPTEQLSINGQKELRRNYCKYCRQPVNSSDRLKHKEKRCISSQPSDYLCGYCRKGFAARESLVEHQRVCTVRKIHKQVKCQHCGITISNRANLRKHQKLSCKFSRRSDEIKQEVNRAESIPKKPLKIKQESSKTTTSLRAKAQSPIESKNIKKEKKAKKPLHPCPYCKRVFKGAGFVRRHMTLCTEKPTVDDFICRYCSTHFSTRSHMYRHQRLYCKEISRKRSFINETLQNLTAADTSVSSPTPKKSKTAPEEHNRFRLLQDSPTDSSTKLIDRRGDHSSSSKQTEPILSSVDLHESRTVDNNNTGGEKEPAELPPETVTMPSAQSSAETGISESAIECEQEQSN